MTEWVALKAQLSSARKDLGVLNQREKDLRAFVTQHMAQNEIDTVRVQDKVKVELKTKVSKGSITKEVIKKGLMSYFNGDEVKVEAVWNIIQDSVARKQTQSVSVTGLKT